MDSQFQELAREIADSVTAKVTESVTGSVTAAVTESVEKRLTSHFHDSDERVKDHIARLEGRIEKRLAIHFEGVRDQVKRGAEGYGATLESIDRRLDRLEKDWKRNFRLHSRVLKHHADRINAIEKEP